MPGRDNHPTYADESPFPLLQNVPFGFDLYAREFLWMTYWTNEGRVAENRTENSRSLVAHFGSETGNTTPRKLKLIRKLGASLIRFNCRLIHTIMLMGFNVRKLLHVVEQTLISKWFKYVFFVCSRSCFVFLFRIFGERKTWLTFLSSAHFFVSTFLKHGRGAAYKSMSASASLLNVAVVQIGKVYVRLAN